MKNRRSPNSRSANAKRAAQPEAAPAKKGGRPPQRSASGAPARGPARGRFSEAPPERRERDKARWVIGIHSVEETMKVRPKAIREIWLREKHLDSQQLREIGEQAERLRITVVTKTAAALDKLGSGHQGVALAVTETPKVDWEDLKECDKAIVILLDGIEDPHNLGSILRTAWLTGVKAILIPADRAVGLTPTVCKIASGGAEHVAVEAVSNMASELQTLKDSGFWSYGLSEKGERVPWEFGLDGKVAWVVGSEGSGLRVPTERACDELVRVPQVDSGSSYNASIALSMALMDTVRQMGTLK